jgi:hypothetical protein
MEHIVFVHDLFRVLMPGKAISGSGISNGTIGFGMETLGIG